jgi:hypothetical protein
MDNIVNIEDYSKETKNFCDNWNDDQIMNLYKAVMEFEKNKSPLEQQIEQASKDFTSNVISQLYELGAEPSDDKIMNDMVIMSMLFQSILTEYFTGECEKTSGEANGIYDYIKFIQKDMFEG